jgi:fumarate reductase subunit C
MAARRTYVRPMEGWWKKNPFFLRYMAREATAVFVYLYGLLLVIGLVDLANGEAAFNEWLAQVRAPSGIAFQLVCLAVFAYHTWSWFVIMPKTMPPLTVAGQRLKASAITASGVGIALILSLVILVATVVSK